MAWFMDSLDKELMFRVGFALLCGFIVGIERHLHKKPIDTRTSVLICLGTTIFIYLGDMLAAEKDASRVLGQVVTGIGFLGAGAIITRQGLVLGMTSAAVVWMLAAIGAAVGFGQFGMGVLLSLVTVIVLTVLQRFEDWTDSLMKKAPAKTEKK